MHASNSTTRAFTVDRRLQTTKCQQADTDTTLASYTTVVSGEEGVQTYRSSQNTIGHSPILGKPCPTQLPLLWNKRSRPMLAHIRMLWQMGNGSRKSADNSRPPWSLGESVCAEVDECSTVHGTTKWVNERGVTTSGSSRNYLVGSFASICVATMWVMRTGSGVALAQAGRQ